METKEAEEYIANMKKQIIITALETNVLKIDDLPVYMGKYIDDFGNDGFISYLAAILSEKKMGAFLTICKSLIKDRKEIESKFGLKIMTIQELNKNGK